MNKVTNYYKTDMNINLLIRFDKKYCCMIPNVSDVVWFGIVVYARKRKCWHLLWIRLQLPFCRFEIRFLFLKYYFSNDEFGMEKYFIWDVNIIDMFTWLRLPWTWKKSAEHKFFCDNFLCSMNVLFDISKIPTEFILRITCTRSTKLSLLHMLLTKTSAPYILLSINVLFFMT